MQDRELSYVQASKTKDAARFYVDRASAGTKLEEITKQMSVSHKRTRCFNQKGISPMFQVCRERRQRLEQEKRVQGLGRGFRICRIETRGFM